MAAAEPARGKPQEQELAGGSATGAAADDRPAKLH